jgi:hypothetical protein
MLTTSEKGKELGNILLIKCRFKILLFSSSVYDDSKKNHFYCPLFHVFFEENDMKQPKKVFHDYVLLWNREKILLL